MPNASPAIKKGYNCGRKPANKGRKLPPEVLTAQEVHALIGGCSRRAPTGLRNRALLTLMYRAGLRVSEALALRPKDLDLCAGAVRVLHGKGARARTVGLDPGAVAVIQEWPERRKTLQLTRLAFVICTLSGGEVHPTYVRVLMRRLAEKAGVEKRVHPHGLRHTHAAELAREGVPMHVIQRQLGHASLAVTSRYIDHLAPMEVVEAMQRRDWNMGDGGGH